MQYYITTIKQTKTFLSARKIQLLQNRQLQITLYLPKINLQTHKTLDSKSAITSTYNSEPNILTKVWRTLKMSFVQITFNQNVCHLFKYKNASSKSNKNNKKKRNDLIMLKSQ